MSRPPGDHGGLPWLDRAPGYLHPAPSFPLPSCTELSRTPTLGRDARTHSCPASCLRFHSSKPAITLSRGVFALDFRGSLEESTGVMPKRSNARHRDALVRSSCATEGCARRDFLFRSPCVVRPPFSVFRIVRTSAIMQQRSSTANASLDRIGVPFSSKILCNFAHSSGCSKPGGHAGYSPGISTACAVAGLVSPVESWPAR
jgi:hypothetical protein